MKNELQTKLNTALQDVDWHGEEQVLRLIRQQQKPVRFVRPTKTLVLAIVLILALATTALAFTMHFSRRYENQVQAKKAVQAEYGLTDEMMDLFTYEATKTEEGIAAIFKTDNVHRDSLGFYTVRRTDGGVLDAVWSHDDADQTLLDSGSLASPAWGKKQLEKILLLYREQARGWTAVADFDALTLQQKAALDAPLLQIQELGMLINIEPGEEDLSVQDAESIARKAVADKYGIAEENLSGFPTKVSFLLYGGTERREYRFMVSDYVVSVASPDGTITSCRWMVQEDDRTLPNGDLSRYPEAAEEFISTGAFDLLSPEKKALVTKRYMEAGLEALLPRRDFSTSSVSNMKEQDACKQASETIKTAYHLPYGWESLFLVRTSAVNDAQEQEWLIEYLPNQQKNWHWSDFHKLGVYTVTLNAMTGQVLSYHWSLQEIEVGEYTEQSFAAAPAFGETLLPWVMDLLGDLQSILERYPQYANLSDMTLEDQGAYDARMRQAGYSAKQNPALIPSTSDMPQEEAAAIALDALHALYDLSSLNLVRGEPCQEGFSMLEQDGQWVRVWDIVYSNNMDLFTVQVNAETGEIENIWHDSPAFGNG